MTVPQFLALASKAFCVGFGAGLALWSVRVSYNAVGRALTGSVRIN